MGKLDSGTLDKAAVVGMDGENAGAGRKLLQVVPDFEKIDGWLKLDTAELLFLAASSVTSGCIVEIGSYRGRSTIALAAGSSAGGRLPVYAIEPHEHFVGPKGGVFGPNDRRVFFKNILTTRFSGLVRLINSTSNVVSHGWDKPVSLLFIDGDHRYEAVLSDFSHWRPHLIDGAIIIFHDVSGTGTSLVIDDLIGERCLRHVQTAGRLAMYEFCAADGAVAYDGRVLAGNSRLIPEINQVTRQPAPSRFDAYLFYSARGNYIYQGIPGCGQIATLAALRQVEGLAPGAKSPKPSGPADVLTAGNGVFKFTMVRDPYQRLASVYANSIAADHVPENQLWIEQIRDAAAAQGDKISEKITFEEFVRIVSRQPVEEMDALWCPQHEVGRFAEVAYDFVGRTEVMEFDLAYILERLDAPPGTLHRAIEAKAASIGHLARWSLVSGEVRQDFLKAFGIDFDTLRYPVRKSSVVFKTVNVDNPKLAPFVLSKAHAETPKRHKRKPERAQRYAALKVDSVGVEAKGVKGDGE